MAGVVPLAGDAPGRKQWNIRDRRSSRKIRSQMAEDGCPESQLVLAKQLLGEKSVVSVDDNEENARLGVFWLIKASEQGNVEATKILHQCFETGEGITEHNYLDVKACLSTSQNEKLAKRAAREMFMSLSAGQNFITSEQLRRRMSKINPFDSLTTLKTKEGDQNLENDCLEAEKECTSNSMDDGIIRNDEDECNSYENLGWNAKYDNFGEKLTEDHLENAASNYSRGELPLVQRVFALSDPHQRQVRNLNYLQRTLLYPFVTVHQMYLKLLNHFSLRSRNNPFSLFSGAAYFQIFVAFFLYHLINVENLVLFFPMCIYYLSFFFMVVSTLQMIQSNKEYRDFRVWSRLFLSYDRDGNLNTEDAEFEYCKKNLRPYGLYFLNLLLNLVVYPFISELWFPQSEFAIISFALTFLTLYSFRENTSKNINILLLFSFAINLLAKYPYETDGVVRQTWRFLDIELPTLQSYSLPCFASQIVGNGVEFCLNFRGFFYLLMPGIFIKMASKENWRGTYKILIPHCVTLSWWQVAVLCCQGATLYGLIRSTLALVGLVFFLPLAGIATIILPIVAVFKHFTDAALTSKTGIVIIAATISVIIGYYKRRLHFGYTFIRVQIIVALISALILLCPSIISFLKEDASSSEAPIQPNFTWEMYNNVCQMSSWDKRSIAEIQHGCLRFSGVKVNWEGVVDNVKIVKVQNNLLKFLDNTPQFIRSKLLCYYGEPYNTDCTDEEDQNQMQLCKVMNQINSGDKCHINSWNKYEFEISVKMISGNWNSRIESGIRLTADDSLKNISLKLHPNDRIWFSGILSYPQTIGTPNLMLDIEEIGCVNCFNENLTSMKRKINKVTYKYFAKEIYNGFRRILNFVFNPIINFR